MNPADLADATARALDQLPPEDPARSDPRMLRDARLVEESRLTRETAAEVWLAVSPLRVAPPDVLQAVLSEIQPELSASPGRPRYLTWVAASGWAAAVAVAISLWPKSVETPSQNVGIKEQEPQNRREETGIAATPHHPRLREEIVRLQERLATLRDDPAHRTPRVISLAAPGATPRTEEEAKRRVHSILTNALRSALEAASGAPSDPAALVIERGWLPGGLSVPADGGVIRHRNFPEQKWQEMGLSRSADGEYYDASSQFVWSADPEGRGFIGRKITEEEDLARFTREPDLEAIVDKPLVAPEGFMIGNPVANTTDIFIENVPVLPEGKQLVVRVTDSDGNTTDIPLTQTAVPPVETPAEPPAAPASPEASQLTALDKDSAPFTINPNLPQLGNSSTGFDSLSGSTGVMGYGNTSQYSNIVGYMNGGSIILSFPNGTIPAGFQLLEGSLSPTTVPPKIIVESGP